MHIFYRFLLLLLFILTYLVFSYEHHPLKKNVMRSKENFKSSQKKKQLLLLLRISKSYLFYILTQKHERN